MFSANTERGGATFLLLLLTNAAATLFLCGLIWLVQVTHYALFEKVGAAGWASYHAAHTRTIAPVVALPMLVEIATAFLLLMAAPPPALSGARGLLVVGAVLAALTWLTTAIVFLPMHDKLAANFDVELCRQITRLNWMRTVLWTARAGVVLDLLRRCLLHLCRPQYT